MSTIVAKAGWSRYLMTPLTIGISISYLIMNINMQQFAELIRDALITTCTVDDPRSVSRLDNLVLNEGYSSSITLHGRTPGDGYVSPLRRVVSFWHMET